MTETKITIKRVEAGRVIFDVEGGGEGSLPYKLFPKPVACSQVFFLEAVRENEAEARHKDMAKALLNEILKPNEESSTTKKQTKA